MLFLLVFFVLSDDGKSNSNSSKLKSDLTYNFHYLGTSKKSLQEILSVSYSCGTDLTCILENEILTISGTGSMNDYSTGNDMPWASDRNLIKTIEILEGVKTVGSYAFYQCVNAEKVTIPNSIISIGSFAFYSCTKLTSVTIPEKVLIIENSLFSNCENLVSIKLLGDITSIGSKSFNECSSLEEIEIPETVTSIGTYGFNYCGLKSITFPKKISRFEERVFNGCKQIISMTFLNNQISYLGPYAFHLCQKVQYINMTVDNCVLETYSLAGLNSAVFIELNGIVTSIGKRCFSDAHSCKSIGGFTGTRSIGSQAFYYCGNMLEFTIPERVTSLSTNIFQHCFKLSVLHILGHITSVGGGAFYQCNSLETVYYYGQTVPSYSGTPFSYGKVKFVYVKPFYTNSHFCKVPVAPFPTAYFTLSEAFSSSNIFTNSMEFSKSYQFSSSNVFSISDDFTQSWQFSKSDYFASQDFSKSNQFTLSYIFSKSNEFTSSFSFTKETEFVPTIPPNKITHSISFSLTYVKKRSVTHSISYINSNTISMTYLNEIDDYTILFTHSYYQCFFPYIIEYLSPLYVQTFIKYVKNDGKNKISPEQLIGAVCGSVSVFFIVLGIIILVLRKKNRIDISTDMFDDLSSSVSDNKDNDESSKENSDSYSVSSNNDNDESSIENNDSYSVFYV